MSLWTSWWRVWQQAGWHRPGAVAESFHPILKHDVGRANRMMSLKAHPNVTPPPRPQLLVLPCWGPPIEDQVFKCMSLCGEILIQSFAGYKGCMDSFFTLFRQTLVAKDLIQNTHSFYLGWWKYPALLLMSFCRALKNWAFSFVWFLLRWKSCCFDF